MKSISLHDSVITFIYQYIPNLGEGLQYLNIQKQPYIISFLENDDISNGIIEVKLTFDNHSYKVFIPTDMKEVTVIRESYITGENQIIDVGDHVMPVDVFRYLLNLKSPQDAYNNSSNI